MQVKDIFTSERNTQHTETCQIQQLNVRHQSISRICLTGILFVSLTDDIWFLVLPVIFCQRRFYRPFSAMALLPAEMSLDTGRNNYRPFFSSLHANTDFPLCSSPPLRGYGRAGEEDRINELMVILLLFNAVYLWQMLVVLHGNATHDNA